MNNETLAKIQGYAIQYGIALLSAVLIFIIGKWVANIITGIIEKGMARSKVNPTLVSFTKNIIYFAILTFVSIAALDKLGIQTNSFTAIIAAAGLAIGFALQGSLSNFAAGVMIILFQPFKVGDFVEAGGAVGKVQEIQIFSTIILGVDNKKFIVPNSKITGDKISIDLSKK